jgi:hypothetical protein
MSANLACLGMRLLCLGVVLLAQSTGGMDYSALHGPRSRLESSLEMKRAVIPAGSFGRMLQRSSIIDEPSLDSSTSSCSCPGACTTLSGTRGYLSDGFSRACPQAQVQGGYMNNLKCWWILRSDTQQAHLSLVFTRFSQDITAG